MAAFEPLRQPPSADFADRLAGGPSRPRSLKRNGTLLAGLVLLCFLPRVLMVWKLGSVSDDGYFYLFVADALDRGDFDVALHYLNINIYPLILLALHRLGLEWVTAGQVCGVTLCSLLVLPLFGWVRRHFDDRVAVTACFLYAVHPELIELSIEPIRDTTYWFLITLFLYVTSRAVIEMKWWLFGLAGLVMALAIHTRSEGWILVLLLAAWSLLRGWAVPAARGRLAWGTLLSLAMVPALILVVNVTVLRGHPQWEWGRLNHFQTGYRWLQSPSPWRVESEERRDQNSPPATGQSPSTTGHSPPATHHPARAHSLELVRKYVFELVASLEYVNGLLLLIGIVLWRHLFLQRDKSVLLCMSLMTMLAVWIRLSQIGNLNGRYFLPVFFFAVPYEALALLWLISHLGRLGHRMFQRDLLRVAPALGLPAVLIVLFWIDALSTKHERREADVSLGQSLESRYGPFRSGVVHPGAGRVGYSALGKLPVMHAGYFPIDRLLKKHSPQLVILSTKKHAPSRLARELEQLDAHGYHRIDAKELPATAREFLVFTEERMTPSMANRHGGSKRR